MNLNIIILIHKANTRCRMSWGYWDILVFLLIVSSVTFVNFYLVFCEYHATHFIWLSLHIPAHAYMHPYPNINNTPYTEEACGACLKSSCMIFFLNSFPVRFLTGWDYLHHDPWKWGIICKKPAPALADGETPAVVNGIDWGQWCVLCVYYLPLCLWSHMQTGGLSPVSVQHMGIYSCVAVRNTLNLFLYLCRTVCCICYIYIIQNELGSLSLIISQHWMDHHLFLYAFQNLNEKNQNSFICAANGEMSLSQQPRDSDITLNNHNNSKK